MLRQNGLVVRPPLSLGNDISTNKQYDRPAMRAQLVALQEQPLIDTILFNDARLIKEGLCDYHVGHGDHVHFSIKPK